MTLLEELNVKALNRYRDAVLLVPIASLENHGCLPLGTDILFSRCILSKLKPSSRVVIAPTISISLSVEHEGMGYTFSLSTHLFCKYMEEILAKYAQVFRRILVVAFHGGVCGVLIPIIREIRSRLGICIDLYSPYHTIENYLREKYRIENYIVHADPIEASILYVCGYRTEDMKPSNLVEVLRILSQSAKTRNKRYVWSYHDIRERYSAEEVIVSEELGKELIIEIVKHLEEAIETLTC